MKLAPFLFLLLPLTLRAALPAEQVEFFEKKIRPILAQECYECHSTAGKQKGGLLLDSRPGWQKGGDSGDAIIPGQADKSPLIQAIRHQDPDLKMPSKGPKLEDRVIKDFEAWVNMGAPDPRDKPSSSEEVAHDKHWSSVLDRRRGWWAFQPIANPPLPAASGWSENPVDRFLAAAMKTAGLAPAAEAEPRQVLRRLSYVLNGLPPTPEETAAFVAAASRDFPGAIRAEADRLLASPRFGETWARHWMDWLRYAETHGSEGDPTIPYSWRYRDYLIRALNADVPYPQLVREHIAGDLLPHPRTNPGDGISESALGAAHYRLVLHGFTPTDAYDELATFTDNQIDTVTKAFLGLTVACARCHNHKFDAISQTDYYALFGIFASTRPATIDVNLPERQRHGAASLSTQKASLRNSLAAAWLQSLDQLPERMEAWAPGPQKVVLDEKKREKKLPPEDLGPLADWLELQKAPVEKWPGIWKKLRDRRREVAAELEKFRAQTTAAQWDLRGPDFTQWQSSGAGVQQGPTAAGEFHLLAEGERIVSGIYPAGVYSHLLSDRHRAVLASPRFTAEGGKVWAHLRGGGEARARYVVRNYPRTGTVYPKLDLSVDNDQWVSWDVSYWKGDTLHVEISTDSDQPVETKKKDRSWFGVSEVRYLPDAKASAPPSPTVPLFALCDPETPAPANAGELARLYADLLRRCLKQWQAGQMTDAEAEFLGYFVRQDLLPNRLADLPEIAPLIAQYRATEAEAPAPTRAPGLLEGYAFDQPLFTRGDHKKLEAPVPRRFLEAIDARPYQPGERESGRRQLAESMVSPKNPLTARVIANRLWLHTFGQGLVTTPDNFGRLGEAPTHPELLDYLATAFQAQGGSIKAFLRALVTSRAFRMDHRASPAAAERDPQNKLLSHFPPRRLQAEAIRDTMVALSGKLSPEIGGDSTGPGSNRRSVYGKVARNNLDPLLAAFDFPVPSATRGRRDATNVPAQALALLNDQNVNRWATEWAKRTLANTGLKDDGARVGRMFEEAFSRPALPTEIEGSVAYLRTAKEDAAQQKKELEAAESEKAQLAREIAAQEENDGSPDTTPAELREHRARLADLEKHVETLRTRVAETAGPDGPWRSFAQALFNTKELIYLQ